MARTGKVRIDQPYALEDFETAKQMLGHEVELADGQRARLEHISIESEPVYSTVLEDFQPRLLYLTRKLQLYFTLLEE